MRVTPSSNRSITSTRSSARPIIAAVISCVLLLGACSEVQDIDGRGRSTADCTAVVSTPIRNEFLMFPAWPASSPAPETLVEAVEHLDDILSTRQRLLLACRDPEELAIATHHTLGLWLRNSWRLHGESALVASARDMGFLHADDVSSTIVRTYARRLQGLPDDLESWQLRLERAWATGGPIPEANGTRP